MTTPALHLKLMHTNAHMKAKVIAALFGMALLAGCSDDSNPDKIVSGPETSASAFHGTDITGIDYQTDFQLTDHNGKPRTMADFQGQVTLVFFGFANCPDVCPTTLARMGGAVNQLGADGENVQGLFITLDPRRDTAEVVKEYVSRFHPSFLGLRGDEDSLEKLTKNYHIHMKSHAKTDEHGEHVEENYMVEHSSAVFVLDQAGKLRLVFVGADWTSDQMAHDLKRLLKTS
jgi:protein SCO1/2